MKLEPQKDLIFFLTTARTNNPAANTMLRDALDTINVLYAACEAAIEESENIKEYIESLETENNVLTGTIDGLRDDIKFLKVELRDKNKLCIRLEEAIKDLEEDLVIADYRLNNKERKRYEQS